MIHCFRRFIRLRRQMQKEQRDRGDTLIEILITITIVSIAMAALLGGLLTTASASTTHRNLADIDAALRSFAETAKYAIQTTPSDGPNAGPLFTTCTAGSGAAPPATYVAVGAPYPSTGGPGSTVTVFGLGFSAFNGAPQIGLTNLTNPRIIDGSTAGAVSVFTIPPGTPPGTYTIHPFGTLNPSSPVQFTVTNSLPIASPFANYYKLNAKMQYWNGAGWSSSCTLGNSSNLQQITFTLTNSQSNNGSQDQVNEVLANYGFRPPATVTTSIAPAPPNPDSLGSSFTFRASVVQATGYSSSPTGTITWSFPSGTPNGNQNCPSFTVGSGPFATCTITGANAGTFTPLATYNGDQFNGPAAGSQASMGVNPAQGTYLSVTPSPASSPSGPTVGSTVTYTATITPQGGITPTGTVTWTPPAGTSCAEGASPQPLPAKCTVHNVPFGTQTATATYGGDTACPSGPNCNYPTQTSSGSVNVLEPTSVAVSASSTLSGSNTNVTFTATVTSPTAIAHGDQLTWTGVPTGATCTSPATLPNNPPYTATCTINNVPQGTTYSPVASFGGDATHATSSSPPISYTVPSVVWTHSLVLGPGQQPNVLTITATLSGGSAVAGESVTMSITGSPGTAVCSTTLNSSGQGQCVITGVSASSNYTATITYNGDTSFAAVKSTSPGFAG